MKYFYHSATVPSELTPSLLTFNYTHVWAVCTSLSTSVQIDLPRFLRIRQALLYYDLLLEFASEVQHIWHSQWSVVKALYLWIRYGFLVHITFILIVDAYPSSNTVPIASSSEK